MNVDTDQTEAAAGTIMSILGRVAIYVLLIVITDKAVILLPSPERGSYLLAIADHALSAMWFYVGLLGLSLISLIVFRSRLIHLTCYLITFLSTFIAVWSIHSEFMAK